MCLHEALKAVYGPSHQMKAPLHSSDRSTLLIKKCWSEHFEGLFDDQCIVQESSLAKIPQVDVKLELDQLMTDPLVKRSRKPQCSCLSSFTNTTCTPYLVSDGKTTDEEVLKTASLPSIECILLQAQLHWLATTQRCMHAQWSLLQRAPRRKAQSWCSKKALQRPAEEKLLAQARISHQP